MPLRGRKPVFRFYLYCLALVLLIFLPACKEQEAWDAKVAAKVNGRPIKKESLERVLEWGFYPDLDQGGERDINIPLIMDKLINEELILQEAEKIAILPSHDEIKETLSELPSVWLGGQPDESEEQELNQTLKRHLLLKKMTRKVMDEKREYSAEKWHEFWEKWPKERSASFYVQVLLLAPLDEAPQIPLDVKTLEEISNYFKAEGQAALLSQSIWMTADKLEPLIVEELKAAHREGRLSVPIRLDESWAIYDIKGLEEGPSAAEEFEKAKKEYENQAAEEAFRKWLLEIRSKAQIEYAPSMTSTSSVAK